MNLKGRDRGLLYIGIVFAVLWTAVPIYWTFWASVQFESSIYSAPHLLPENLTSFWYKEALGLPVPESEKPHAGIAAGDYLPKILAIGFKNTIIVSLTSSVVAVIVASLAAYVFGRLRFRFKNGLLAVLLTSQTLPPVAVIIPYFILFNILGLVGSILGLFIVYLSLLIPLLTWVLMSFFATLPLEVERQARIDGCTRLMVLRKIIAPMAAPGIFAGWILGFLIAYNEFIYALILSSGSPAQTLPLSLTALFLYHTTLGELGSSILLSLLPVFILAMIFQRYITQLRLVDPVSVVIR